jgi:hypothetical protein
MSIIITVSPAASNSESFAIGSYDGFSIPTQKPDDYLNEKLVNDINK